MNLVKRLERGKTFDPTLSRMLVEHLVDCENKAPSASSASAIASNLVVASIDKNSCTDCESEGVPGEIAEDRETEVLDRLDSWVRDTALRWSAQDGSGEVETVFVGKVVGAVNERKGRWPYSLSANVSIEMYRGDGEEVGEGDREVYRSSL